VRAGDVVPGLKAGANPARWISPGKRVRRMRGGARGGGEAGLAPTVNAVAPWGYFVRIVRAGWAVVY
jgi:hypothetical protein